MAPLVGIFTFALLHTLIPSHWLCFVVVGRAHGWKTRKTLAVAGAAGLLHVISTVAVGAAGGAWISSSKHVHTMEVIGAWTLIALGGLYLVTHALHAGHHHESDNKVGEKAAFISLLFSLVLSPCTAATILLMAQVQGPLMIALVGLILLVTTVGGMLLLVGLTTLGIEKLQFAFFDRYEKLILGGVLVLLGILVLVVPHHH
ncbi:MAG TPA: hypothetical protein VF950_00120 [Planctomycetota bacterium]